MMARDYEGVHVGGERGSGALLLMSVLVPFFFFLLTISLDLNTFFEQRQTIQALVDEGARRLLRGSYSISEAEDSIKNSLQDRRGVVAIDSIESGRTVQSASIAVRGRYTSTFAKFFSAFISSGKGEFPFAISARVARTRFSITVLFDLSLRSLEDPCEDHTLNSQKNLVLQITSALKQLAPEGATVAALHPGAGSVLVLPLFESSGELLFCGGAPPESVEAQILGIRGSDGYHPDKYAYSTELAEIVLNGIASTRSPRHLVVLITRAFDDRWSELVDLQDLLRSIANESQTVVSAVRVIAPPPGVGTDCQTDWPESHSQLFRSKCLTTNSFSELRSGFTAALLSDATNFVLEQ